VLGELALQELAVLFGLIARGVVFQHLLHQYGHGGQGRAPFVGGAGGRAGHRQDLVIAQTVLTLRHRACVLLAQLSSLSGSFPGTGQFLVE
jgi:hypothetical protein